ncbi:MAG: LysM peptidoglycan-binding domain-containing protein [Candidatus Cloacimonetes bacterium]|nr:LysM peptidoglycan-binding domain-containing protein [Candidatus Cloacimonadota bacterium]MBL7108516.1 LysM peptidoglycan-binding domain-containing protein [Candidatus Cloacimonadota bacterium]
MTHSKLLIKILIVFSFLVTSAFTPNPKFITPSDDYHIVKKGDTLYSISKKYGLSVDVLKRINNLTSNNIYIGQKIYLKEKKTAKQYYVTEREIPKCGYHIVKKGETLYRISKMYNISLVKIMEINQLFSYTIKTGEKIWLKQTSDKNVPIKSDKKVNVTKKTTSKPVFHIVQKGENLYRIATKYDLSIYELKRYNNLSSSQITAGQKLFLTQQKIDKKKYTKKSSKISADFKKYNLIWPFNGEITSKFGMRNGRPHKGLDIASPVGTPIQSVLDGEVAYVGKQRGYGNVIILKHNNELMTVYAHNDENLVEKGDNVKKGDKIATVGMTGNTTGAHLHFEVRLEGRAMDPQKFLP